MVFHKSQISFVLTPHILQQIQELANKLKQPDQALCSMLSSLVFLSDAAQQPLQNTSGELYGKLRELLKEYTQQQRAATAAASHSETNEKIPNYAAQLTDYIMQIRHIAAQLKNRLKQCHLFNSYPSCITSNSILDLL
jgi:hypothetical protein